MSSIMNTFINYVKRCEDINDGTPNADTMMRNYAINVVKGIYRNSDVTIGDVDGFIDAVLKNDKNEGTELVSTREFDHFTYSILQRIQKKNEYKQTQENKSPTSLW